MSNPASDAIVALVLAGLGAAALTITPTPKPEQVIEKPPVEQVIDAEQAKALAEEREVRLETLEQQLQKIEEQTKRIDAKIEEKARREP